jgi:serine/threonine protein phosphatase PrpC
MQVYILPQDNSQSNISKIVVDQHLVLATTTGLVKKTNEDRVGYRKTTLGYRLSICDGHWGDKAAQLAIEEWLNDDAEFPISKEDAIHKTKVLEDKLFSIFGKAKMDSQKDFTPETAFIAVEISGDKLTIISYGDCRLIICANQEIQYQHPTSPTWLGAFSHLGLRDRFGIEESLQYKTVKLADNQKVLMFTDGVDECIYEKPTIGIEVLAELTSLGEPEQILDSIIKSVFDYGAEDNAGLIVFKN